jgi:threonylcarbamoyladenosine tRNA methylthiotransferase MtaB
VSRDIKRQRSEALHQLGETMKRQTLEAHLDKTLPILVEGSTEKGLAGYTPNYLRVEIAEAANTDLINQIVAVKLTALSDDGNALLGSIT